MHAVSPVVPGLEHAEKVIAKDQPEYLPLPSIRAFGAKSEVLTRWTLTEQERLDIASGADIMVEQFTFGHQLQPLRVYPSTQLPPKEDLEANWQLPPPSEWELSKLANYLMANWGKELSEKDPKEPEYTANACIRILEKVRALNTPEATGGAPSEATQ